MGALDDDPIVLNLAYHYPHSVKEQYPHFTYTTNKAYLDEAFNRIKNKNLPRDYIRRQADIISMVLGGFNLEARDDETIKFFFEELITYNAYMSILANSDMVIRECPM